MEGETVGPRPVEKVARHLVLVLYDVVDNQPVALGRRGLANRGAVSEILSGA